MSHKITILKEDILKCMLASNYAIGKSTMPILESFLMIFDNGTCYVIGQGEDISITTQFKVEYKQNFSVCAPAAEVINIIKMMPDEFDFLFNESNKLTIKSKTKRYSLACHNADQFPQLHYIDNQPPVKVSYAMFSDCIRRSAAFVDSKDIRIQLSGISIRMDNDKLEICGANNATMFRGLCKIDQQIPEMIITKRTAGAIDSLQMSGEIEIFSDGKKVMFKCSGITIIALLINVKGGFPSIKKFWDQAKDNYIIVSRKDLISVMKGMSSVANNLNEKIIKIHYKDEILKFTSENKALNQDGEEIVESIQSFGLTEYEGGFDFSKITDILNTMNSDNIEIRAEVGKFPMFINPESKSNVIEYNYLIAPISL